MGSAILGGALGGSASFCEFLYILADIDTRPGIAAKKI